MTEYRASEEYEDGEIIFQTPNVGTKGQEGDVISVIVSSGNDTETVPSLIGMTVEEALTAIHGLDLEIGAVEYGPSDMPAGQIYQQDPLPEEDTFAGDTINVYVSGTASVSVEMPSLVSTPTQLDAALEILLDAGFSHIIVHPEVPDILAAEAFCQHHRAFHRNGRALGMPHTAWTVQCGYGLQHRYHG